MTVIPPIQSFEDFERETLAMILPAYVPKFGPITWADTFKPAQSYPWLVKGLIPDGEAILKFGATQTGKSFSTQHLAFCVARGLPFFGHRVRRAGVVYCAFEGGKGFRRRQLAYAQHHGLTADSDIPMTVLTRRADLFSNDVDFDALCLEIDHYGSGFSQELGLIVLDTWSASTPGADENAAKDVSKVRQRIMKIVDRFRSAVIVVHHKPAASEKPRGHTSLSADFETTIDVDWEGELRDAKGRRIRRAKLVKQREGDTDISWSFVLRRIDLGVDQDGEDVTSCVIEEPDGGTEAASPGSPFAGKTLTSGAKIALQALREAIINHGEAPLSAMRLPNGVMVVRYEFWRRVMVGQLFEPDEDVTSDKARQSIKRIGNELIAKKVIGRENPFVWIAREPSN